MQYFNLKLVDFINHILSLAIFSVVINLQTAIACMFLFSNLGYSIIDKCLKYNCVVL